MDIPLYVQRRCIICMQALIKSDKMTNIGIDNEMENNIMKKIAKEGAYYKLSKLRKQIKTNDISMELLEEINDTLYDFIKRTKW